MAAASEKVVKAEAAAAAAIEVIERTAALRDKVWEARVKELEAKVKELENQPFTPTRLWVVAVRFLLYVFYLFVCFFLFWNTRKKQLKTIYWKQKEPEYSSVKIMKR